MRCLVVADNVSDKEGVSKLLETGSAHESTRNAEQITAHGEAVGVEELSEVDTKSVARMAGDLPSEVRLSDNVEDLIDLGVFVQEGGGRLAETEALFSGFWR